MQLHISDNELNEILNCDYNSLIEDLENIIDILDELEYDGSDIVFE